jgi:hypothetical protein
MARKIKPKPVLLAWVRRIYEKPMLVGIVPLGTEPQDVEYSHDGKDYNYLITVGTLEEFIDAYVH